MSRSDSVSSGAAPSREFSPTTASSNGRRQRRITIVCESSCDHETLRGIRRSQNRISRTVTVATTCAVLALCAILGAVIFVAVKVRNGKKANAGR